MLYPVVRPLAALTLKLFFKKIYISNAELLPKGKPTLLVSNHPTTFTEPCIFACFLDRPFYYLVRGDFFENPFFDALLRDLHMIPIYRLKDGGYKNLKQNFSTFDSTLKWLKAGKTVMILAEGTAIYEKRLRPLRKGTARIVLKAMEEAPDLDLYIAPVGVNYTDSNKMRSEVMIRFAEPFPASDFFGPGKGPKGFEINRFTQYLKEKLTENIVIIEQPEDEWLTERLLEIQRNNFKPGHNRSLDSDGRLLQMEIQMANAINRMENNHKIKLKKETKQYFSRLDELGITDKILKNPPARTFLPGSYLVFLAGYILNWPPLMMVLYIVENKIIFNEFFGSVRIATSLGFFLFYYIFVFLILMTIFGIPGIFIFALFPLLGYFSLKYWFWRRDWKTYVRYRKLSDVEKENLLSTRGALLQFERHPIQSDC